MNKIKDFLKSFIGTLIVMFGSYLTSLYLKYGFSLVGIFAGLIGFLILYPAVKAWEEKIWKSNAKQD